MIIINGKRKNNLIDQVAENRDLIAKHYEIDRTLANFGIKIVGVVATKDDLPDPETYAGVYGDGYAVGDHYAVSAGEASYDYYIYTRPQEGQLNGYWLDVGQLAIRGPQGEQGPQGEKGDPGNDAMWYTGTSYPEYRDYYKMGDMYLRVGLTGPENGNVYWFNGLSWDGVGNILGPQGIRGPQGPKGDRGETGATGAQGPQGLTGTGVTILGTVNSVSNLPTASSGYNGKGYLVGTSAPYSLYTCIPDGASYRWINLGTYSGSSVVLDANGNAMPTVQFVQLNNPILYEHQLNVSFWYGSEHYTYYYDKVSANAVTLNFNVSSNPTIGAISPLVFQGNSWQAVSGIKDNDGSYQDNIVAIKRNSNTQIEVMYLTGNGEGEHAEATIIIPLSEITDVVTKDFKNQINYNT